MMNAAIGNGLASTWNELDDGYTKTAVHPGARSYIRLNFYQRTSS